MFRDRKKTTVQIRQLVVAGCTIAIGLILFKFLPMRIWGRDIRFDASMHIATAIFVLYFLWFFVDQNKSWHTPFFLFAAVVLVVISVQRIAENAHNDIGLLSGLVLGLIGIGISRWKSVRAQLQF